MYDQALIEPTLAQMPASSGPRHGGLRARWGQVHRLGRRVASSTASACVASVVGLLLAIALASGW